eukprot:Phypoly_transcript_11015.p1 GENE.Phypoly_transcript_11015~~Phypoly_transcript_11015.p1  ORF type:complete len:417 (+),score=49.72 Phypoly_transcript_11015:31-1251(+)
MEAIKTLHDWGSNITPPSVLAVIESGNISALELLFSWGAKIWRGSRLLARRDDQDFEKLVFSEDALNIAITAQNMEMFHYLLDYGCTPHNDIFCKAISDRRFGKILRERNFSIQNETYSIISHFAGNMEALKEVVDWHGNDRIIFAAIKARDVELMRYIKETYGEIDPSIHDNLIPEALIQNAGVPVIRLLHEWGMPYDKRNIMRAAVYTRDPHIIKFFYDLGCALVEEDYPDEHISKEKIELLRNLELPLPATAMYHAIYYCDLDLVRLLASYGVPLDKGARAVEILFHHPEVDSQQKMKTSEFLKILYDMGCPKVAPEMALYAVAKRGNTTLMKVMLDEWKVDCENLVYDETKINFWEKTEIHKEIAKKGKANFGEITTKKIILLRAEKHPEMFQLLYDHGFHY